MVDTIQEPSDRTKTSRTDDETVSSKNNLQTAAGSKTFLVDDVRSRMCIACDVVIEKFTRRFYYQD